MIKNLSGKQVVRGNYGGARACGKAKRLDTERTLPVWIVEEELFEAGKLGAVRFERSRLLLFPAFDIDDEIEAGQLPWIRVRREPEQNCRRRPKEPRDLKWLP